LAGVLGSRCSPPVDSLAAGAAGGQATTRARLARLALLLTPAAAVFAVFAPVLGLGFFADDFLTNWYLDHDSATPRVAWWKVAREFTSPCQETLYYRPLWSVLVALRLAFVPADPWIAHLVGVAVHATAAVLVAVTCSMLCNSWCSMVALLGGLLFGVQIHAVETLAWYSAHAGVFALALGLASIAAFTRHLLAPERWTLVAGLAAAAASLLCKESAITLPLSLAAVHLMLRLQGRTRVGARVHLWFVPVWAGYLILRFVALGDRGSPGDGLATIARALVDAVLPKLGVLWMPEAATFTWQRAVWILFLALLAVQAWRRRALPVLLLAVAWPSLLLAPFYTTSLSPFDPASRQGRLIYDATAALAIGVAACGAMCLTPSRGQRGRPWTAALGILLLGSSIAGQVVSIRADLGDWTDASLELGRFRTAVASAGSEDGKPLGLVGAPFGRDGIPALSPMEVFGVFQVPFVARDRPVVELTFVFVAVATENRLLHDASPLRAFYSAGFPLLFWGVPGKELHEVRRREDAAVPRCERTGRNTWTFADGPVSPYDFEACELELGQATTSGRLVVLPEIAGVHTPFATAASHGDGRRVFVDLSHDHSLLTRERLGGVRGFRVDLDGGATSEVRSLLVHRRVPVLGLHRELAGASLVLGREHEVLVAPAGPTEGRARLVLLLPTSGEAAAVTPGAPVTFPKGVVAHLRRMLPFYRRRVLYYCFEYSSPTRTERSAVDWFRIVEEAK
jgi:hypothetical protein